jgi:hypothetical protein
MKMDFDAKKSVFFNLQVFYIGGANRRTLKIAFTLFVEADKFE